MLIDVPRFRVTGTGNFSFCLKKASQEWIFFENTVPHLPPLNLSDLWWGVPGGQEKSSLNAEKKQGGNEWSKVQINKLNQANNTTIFVGPNKKIHGCCFGDFFFYNSHPVFPVPLWTCGMSQWLSYLYSIDGSMQWFFYGHSYLAPTSPWHQYHQKLHNIHTVGCFFDDNPTFDYKQSRPCKAFECSTVFPNLI